MSVSVFSQATLPHPTLSLSLQNPSSLTTAIKSSDIVLVSLGVKWNTGCYQTWNTLLHFQKLLERANESAQAKQTEDLVDMYSDEGGSTGAGSPTRSQSVGSPMKSPVGVADGELTSPTTTGVVVQSLGEELKYVVDELVRRKVSIKTVLLDQDEFVDFCDANMIMTGVPALMVYVLGKQVTITKAGIANSPVLAGSVNTEQLHIILKHTLDAVTNKSTRLNLPENF